MCLCVTWQLNVGATRCPQQPLTITAVHRTLATVIPVIASRKAEPPSTPSHGAVSWQYRKWTLRHSLDAKIVLCVQLYTRIQKVETDLMDLIWRHRVQKKSYRPGKINVWGLPCPSWIKGVWWNCFRWAFTTIYEGNAMLAQNSFLIFRCTPKPKTHSSLHLLWVCRIRWKTRPLTHCFMLLN